MMQKLLFIILTIFSSQNIAFAADYTTTQCTKFGQSEFVFFLNDESPIEADIQWFRSTLEEMVAKGEKFKSGETILVGPVLLKIEAAENNKLRLLEPDMKSMPFKYENSVSRTLKIIRRQRDTAESLGVAKNISFAPFHLPMLVTRNALNASMILMIRSSKQGGSGWLLLDAEKEDPIDNDNIQALSVYEAIIRRPEILDFLALPEQFGIAVESRNNFLIYNNQVLVKPSKGSYLDMLTQQSNK